MKRLYADFGRLHTAAPIKMGKVALPTRPCRQLCRAAGAGNFGEQLAGQCQVFSAVHSCSICAPAEERMVFGLLGGDEEEISSWRNACDTMVAKSCTKSTGEKAQQNNDLSFMIWKVMFQVYDLNIIFSWPKQLVFHGRSWEVYSTVVFFRLHDEPRHQGT